MKKTTVIPTAAATDIEKRLSSLSFWDSLPASAQEALRVEMTQLVGAQTLHVQNGLLLGRHLSVMYHIVEKYVGGFRKLVAISGLHERNGYRFRESYDNAAAAFPNTILEEFIRREVNIISYSKVEGRELRYGKYTDVIAQVPPPSKATEEQAAAYVNKVEATYAAMKRKSREEKRAEATKVHHSPAELLKRNVVNIREAVEQLSEKQRSKFLAQLVGITLTYCGIEEPTTFKPQPVPARL